MNFERNVAGCASVLCYKKEEEYRPLWSKKMGFSHMTLLAELAVREGK